MSVLDLHLESLDGQDTLADEGGHDHQRGHDQEQRHADGADQGRDGGPEATREPQIGGIGNDDDDDGPAERGQKRLEDQEREVGEDGHNPVEQHGAEAFLRALFCAQWLSLCTVRKETDSFNRGVCQQPRGARLRNTQVI